MRRRLHIVREATFSWHNVSLIATQRPTATRVAGFQTWRTMGRFVRKGEKGIAIMAPIIGRREAERDGENARSVVGFRAAYVFDVDQTDGEPLPTPVEASGDPGVKTATLKTAILGQGIALESADDLDGALGTSSSEGIRLLNGLSPAMEFTTLVHEYAHLCSVVRYVRIREDHSAPAEAIAARSQHNRGAVTPHPATRAGS